MIDFCNLNSYKKLKDLSLSPPDLTKCLSNERFNDYIMDNDPLKILFSTERINKNILAELFNLANETHALKKMENMQSGQVMNFVKGIDCENNKVMHTATRDVFDEQRGTKESKFFYNEILKLKKFINENNNKFKTILHIGIGGSELGPKAIYKALSRYKKNKIKVYFISNIDPDNLFSILKKIDLKTTLIISVSKSGTTIETTTNEKIIRKFYNNKENYISITTPNSQMDDLARYNKCFYILDSIGGRFSSTSMVGAVTLSLSFGIDVFMDFLKGAHKMDKIALQTSNNLPLLSALLGIWNINFLNTSNLAIIPYSESLSLFPNHLQQCAMESNGKSISQNASFLNFKPSGILWGTQGTNAQHSFFQFLHQGMEISAIEFIAFKKSQYEEDMIVDDTTSQEKLLANLFAQSFSLAKGHKNENKNKNFEGNRPNHIILANQLTPATLGSLLAFYEHKIAFQGFIWHINSFDQEGVQLGKKLSTEILQMIKKKEKMTDNYLYNYLKEMN